MRPINLSTILGQDKSPAGTAFDIRDPKYTGMDRVVPSDKVDHVAKLVTNRAKSSDIYSDDYKDASQHLKGETYYKEVSSGGTTYKETIQARENPELFSNKLKFEQVSKEIGASSAYAAATGAIIGGSISIVKYLSSQKNLQSTRKQILKNILKDTTKAGVRGGAIGGSGSFIRFLSRDILHNEFLSKSNVATAIAAGLIQTGAIIYKYTIGEIDERATMEAIGQTGFSVAYSLYIGAAIGLVIGGPVAAAVVTTAGYFIANFAYQSTLAILKEADLAEKEAERVTKISDEACSKHQEFQEKYRQVLNKYLKDRHQLIDTCFKELDNSIEKSDYFNANNVLAELAGGLGMNLKLKRFEDFDNFMRSNKTLEI